MKIIQINAVCGRGSTGRICTSVAKLLDEKGVENYIMFSSGRSERSSDIKCSYKLYTKIQALKSRVLGNYGFNSFLQTKRMIRKIEQIQPDIVHLHNIHGHDCHLGMLFDYFRKRGIKLFWTFHDCWAFTAYCPYFTYVRCDQWRTGCQKCPQRHDFFWFADRSKEQFRKKREAFLNQKLTIITPSEWLAGLVRESFLNDYPVKTIYSGIDLEVFKPTKSDFRKRHGIADDQAMILGVAFHWGERKGLDVFLELEKRLDRRKYRIVLVGAFDSLRQKMPEHLIVIERTNSPWEQAEIYSAADLFVNPTREEVLGMVNIEALACGIPVLTFRTGGSTEVLDEKTGSVVDCDDVDALEGEIIRICNEKPYKWEDCINRAKEFDISKRFDEYIRLYDACDPKNMHPCEE